MEDSDSSTEERWIPLVEYSAKYQVSLSTLRRYIKANKIEHRKEGGKYLVLDQPVYSKRVYSSRDQTESASENKDLEERVAQLETAFQKAQEEIAELKMLVALYEEGVSPSASEQSSTDSKEKTEQKEGLTHR